MPQMAGHEWEDWFEREEFIGQISDMRVQNLQVEREVVQKRTFTRWMNLHLEKCDPPIEVQDLFRDIQDGHILMALLEELSGCKLLHGFKKSAHRIFRLNNIAKVLSFLEERNVKLVSIDAADVADGNPSIVLGLIWNIILFFQIKELTGNIRSQFPSSSSLSSIPTSSDSDTSFCSTPSEERQSASTAMREHGKAIKKLLQWVQKRTRKYGVAVQDFGKSWRSGVAFLAVIKSIDPSLVDMRRALLRSAKENLEDAFRIAHYSLGIPRLLEPEDVTINTPDEQSIMTYVSQFLEHFPGIEEPEETCQFIERSVSMCRLNFCDSDSDHMRNGVQRSRVKERSYMFQKDCAQLPPKILISSVSEDRSAMSPPFRPAATRSWSSEDFLADRPLMEDIPSSVVAEPKEDSSSPQLSYTHSPVGSSVPESGNTESVIGDSAISSPDSWVESEFGVTPERFCESRSDSSLCDSGTAWDVYHATPVEITNDEGFIPSIEDRVHDEEVVTYIDEGIYSLSSLESAQERIQGTCEKKQADIVLKKEASLENNTQDLTLEHVSDHSEPEVAKEVTSEEIERSVLQKVENLLELGETNQSQLPSNTKLPPAPQFEELLKQTPVKESTSREPDCLIKAGDAQDHEGQIGQAESLNERHNSVEAEVEAGCQKKDSPSKEMRGESREESEILKQGGEGVVDTQDNAREGIQRDNPDPQESFSAEACDILEDTHLTNQDGPSKTSLDPSTAINIPLISISSEPEWQLEGDTCGPEIQDHVVVDEVHEAEATGSKGTDTDVSSPQTPVELSYDLNGNDDQISVEIPSCLVSEKVKPADVCGPDLIDDMEISGGQQECECPYQDSQTGDTHRDGTAQNSSTDAEVEHVKGEQEVIPPDRRQDKLGDACSDNEATTTQQGKVDPVKSEPDFMTGASYCEPGSVSRDMDLFYTEFDRSSPTDDLVSDPVEPMDLFYPDKEEPMFTEAPDHEMQSWPSVLSVSALQPAPASEALPNDPLGEHFGNGLDMSPENDKVIREPDQEADKAPRSQEHCLLLGERVAGLRGGVVPADGSDLSGAEQRSSICARENTEPVRSDTKSSTRQDESQIPPVLRHRKGVRFMESTDKQTAMIAAATKADNIASDAWWSENWELSLLLLLWLLLYCLWLLPQMDLKTLPSLLLNLNH